ALRKSSPTGGVKKPDRYRHSIVVLSEDDITSRSSDLIDSSFCVCLCFQTDLHFQVHAVLVLQEVSETSSNWAM
ncbi:hypothetical protein HAX54_050019, partial [Datura stramonium]|nr:hypothetical protein [Datura stramonium]